MREGIHAGQLQSVALCEQVHKKGHQPASLLGAPTFVWAVGTLMMLFAMYFSWTYGLTVPWGDDWGDMVPVITGDRPVDCNSCGRSRTRRMSTGCLSLAFVF